MPGKPVCSTRGCGQNGPPFWPRSHRENCSYDWLLVSGFSFPVGHSCCLMLGNGSTRGVFSFACVSIAQRQISASHWTSLGLLTAPSPGHEALMSLLAAPTTALPQPLWVLQFSKYLVRKQGSSHSFLELPPEGLFLNHSLRAPRNGNHPLPLKGFRIKSFSSRIWHFPIKLSFTSLWVFFLYWPGSGAQSSKASSYW